MSEPRTEDLLQRLNPIMKLEGDLPGGATAPTLLQRLTGVDPDFDRSGVPSLSFRAQLSMMDTDKERKWYLTKRVGERGWTQDRYGHFALTSEGMRGLGLEPVSNKPTLIDEPRLTRYDVADIAGAGPTILGATGIGMMATGAGFLPGMALAGAGGLLGKLVGEFAEDLVGMNIQPIRDVAKDVVLEGLWAAGGEVLARGAFAIGRKVLAPYLSRMTPEARQLMAEAAELGAKPKAVQLTKPPIVGRFSAMADRIFGDRLARQNSEVLNIEMGRLRSGFGAKRGVGEVGENIVRDIRNTRRALTRWAGQIAGRINEIVKGQPIIPTTRLKAEATEILEGLPPTVTRRQLTQSEILEAHARTGDIPRTVETPGPPALTSKEVVEHLRQIQKLPDSVTITQMQHITSTLWDAVDDTTIIPGMSGRNARLLWKAATGSYDEIQDETVKRLVLPFRREYKKHIEKFDNALVKRIMLDPKFASTIPPERIVGVVFRKGNVQQLRQMRRVIKPARWKQMQRASMDDVLSKIVGRTDDPLVEVFKGRKFLDALDAYGLETLIEMFGRQTTHELYRLGRVTQLVTQRQAMAGGLVAANIALHPWRNFSRLVKIRLLSRLMNTPTGIKWLTEGLRVPKTRAGAAALTRVSAMATMLAEQHTQGKLEDPKEPNGSKITRPTLFPAEEPRP